MKRPLALLFALFFVLLASCAAHAEKADRDKPVNLEADRITVDDANKVQIFEGNVQMVKGTIVMRTDKLVVTQDENGFQKGVAYGGQNGLAYFRQKREGREEYTEGWGERIDHDDRHEKTEFFVRAHIRTGQDEARGNYISYDGRTENYLVSTGPNGTSAPKIAGKDQRVRAVIQPKNKAETDTGKAAPSAAPAAGIRLRQAATLDSPPADQ